MKCHECACWRLTLAGQLPCGESEQGPHWECDIGPLYLRNRAARYRLMAKALDQAAEFREAEMREREEAEP